MEIKEALNEVVATKEIPFLGIHVSEAEYYAFFSIIIILGVLCCLIYVHNSRLDAYNSEIKLSNDNLDLLVEQAIQQQITLNNDNIVIQQQELVLLHAEIENLNIQIELLDQAPPMHI